MLKCNCSHGILWKFERTTLILSLHWNNNSTSKTISNLSLLCFQRCNNTSKYVHQKCNYTCKVSTCKCMCMQSLHILLCIWSFLVLVTNFFYAVKFLHNSVSAATQRQSTEWKSSRRKQSRCAISLWSFLMFPSTCVILYPEQNKTFPNKLSQTFLFQQVSSLLWHFIITKSHLLLHISSHCNCSALNTECTV